MLMTSSSAAVVVAADVADKLYWCSASRCCGPDKAGEVCRCSIVEARPQSDPVWVECDRFGSTTRTDAASACWRSVVDNVVAAAVVVVVGEKFG